MKKNFIIFTMLLCGASVPATSLSYVQQTLINSFNTTVTNANQQIQANFNKLSTVKTQDDITKIFNDVQAQESSIQTALTGTVTGFQSTNYSTDAINKLFTIGYEASQMNAILKSALGKQDEPFISDLPTLLDYQNQVYAQTDGNSVPPHLVINGQIKTEGLQEALGLLQQIKAETAAGAIDGVINNAPPSPTQQIFNSLNAATTGASAAAATSTQGNAVESYYQKILTVLSSAFDSDPLQSLWNAVQNAGKTTAQTVISALTNSGITKVQSDGSVIVTPYDPYKGYIKISPFPFEDEYLKDSDYDTVHAYLTAKYGRDSHLIEKYGVPEQYQHLIVRIKNPTIPPPITLGHMLNGQFLTNKIWEAYNAVPSLDSNGNPLVFDAETGGEQLTIDPNSGEMYGNLDAQRVHVSGEITATNPMRYVVYDTQGKIYLASAQQDSTTKKWSLKLQHVDNLDNVVLQASVNDAETSKNPLTIFDNTGKNVSSQLFNIYQGISPDKTFSPDTIFNSGHYLLFNDTKQTNGFDAYLDDSGNWNFNFIPSYKHTIFTQDSNGNRLAYDQYGKQIYLNDGSTYPTFKDGTTARDTLAPYHYGSSSGPAGIYYPSFHFYIYNKFGGKFYVSSSTTKNPVPFGEKPVYKFSSFNPA